ncbi:MAG: glycosyltransferase family 4 protein [Verrucomicrobiota bacterium]|nr:glycosyltransferase family 4 protein [Verrucomicrobiota bacterium]
MKILMVSYLFLPDVGGISTVASLLAYEFVKRGHQVRVVTTSEGAGPEDYPFEVVRRPGVNALIQHTRWCDVSLNVHVSLRLSWPVLLLGKPWVVSHHSWVTRVDGSLGIHDHVKRYLFRRARCISVSRAVAKSLNTPSVVIGPPYDASVFHPDPGIPRDRDLLFVGRLVSSKGIDVLLEALVLLRNAALTPGLTIVGEGPEGPRVREKVAALGLGDQVTFAGTRGAAELRDTYCAHRIIVVPSVGPETFGLVALEALACGCQPVGSRGAGGLEEAMGPSGVIFEKGNPRSLAAELEKLLREPDPLNGRRLEAEEHLARFRTEQVATEYLKVMMSNES